MRVLITNFRLSESTDSELATCELALGLQARGIRTAVFTSRIGPLADRLIDAKIPVVDRLEDVPFQPQLIHGQGNLETLIALTHLPKLQAVFSCDDRDAWREAPPSHTRILRYASSSPRVAAWFTSGCGISAEKCRVLAAPIKLNGSGNQSSPAQAAVAKAVIHHRIEAPLEVMRTACAIEGIVLETVGGPAGSPQQLLLAPPEVVFASGRAAVEALALGHPVILAGGNAVGEAVTEESYEEAKSRNFAPNPDRPSLTADELAIELATSRLKRTTRLEEFVRQDFDFDATIAAWIGLYREILEASPPRANARRDQKEMAQFLGQLAARGHEEDRKVEAVHESLRRLAQHQINPEKSGEPDVLSETLAAHLFVKSAESQPKPKAGAAPPEVARNSIDYADLALTALARCLLFILSFTPTLLAIATGRLAGHLAFWFDSRRRAIVIRNQTLAFPKLNPRAIRWLAQKQFRRIGENLAGAAKSLTMDAKQASKLFELRDAGRLLDSSGKLSDNVVFATARLGAAELLVRALGEIPGARPATTFRALAKPRLNRLLQARRQRSNAIFLEHGADEAKLGRAMLQQGLALALPADQPPARHGVEIHFFGRPFLANRTPLDVAQHYGCPLHVLTCARIKPGRWRFEISHEIPLTEYGEPRTAAAILQDVHDIFEGAIRRDPANWFWIREPLDGSAASDPKVIFTPS